MPVYVYRRQDGSSFEVTQRITDAGLVSCPTTGQRVERVLQPFSPHYKGSGFYSTDSRKPEAKEQPPSGGRDTHAHNGPRSEARDRCPDRVRQRGQPEGETFN